MIDTICCGTAIGIKSNGNHVTFPIYTVKMFCEGPVPLLVLLT
jgi:hypothetical protein